MEELFLEQLSRLPSEGIRIKKFRKSIFDSLLRLDPLFNEDIRKQEFQELLDSYLVTEDTPTQGEGSKGILTVDNGFIKKVNPIRMIKHKKRSREDDDGGEDTSTRGDLNSTKKKKDDDKNPFEIAIQNLLNELSSEGIRLKKFRQQILDQFASSSSSSDDLKIIKEQFAENFEKLCQSGYAKEENGIVTRVGDVIPMKRMKVMLPIVNQEVAKKEMWKYGEQVWADGTLDQEYLINNPDGITRLFCGNLKKTITEEQLHNAINGIVFIKWMTDKTTREFYGSTFLEMKDPAAAAAAVLLDKTKLLGRFVDSFLHSSDLLLF